MTHTSDEVHSHPRKILQKLCLGQCFLDCRRNALSAFVLSFFTQRNLAIEAGISPQYAWLVPLIIDMTIVALSATVTQKRLNGESISLLVWSIVVASLLTILFNVYLSPKTLSDQNSVVTQAYLPGVIPPTFISIAIHGLPL